jgi:hypothetical protein
MLPSSRALLSAPRISSSLAYLRIASQIGMTAISGLGIIGKAIAVPRIRPRKTKRG